MRRQLLAAALAASMVFPLAAFAVGGHVLIWGRIQSREYMKRLSETEMEKRTAYEVSVSKLEYSES